MDLQTQLYIAQAIHNFWPWLVGGVAYIMFLVTLWEVLTISKIIAYLVLSALTWYVIYFFASILYSKIMIILGVTTTRETELLRIISWLWGFLHKQAIEWVRKWTPEYINKYAEKWVK